MGHDWLEYTTSLDHWGDGHKLNHLERNAEVNTSSATVYLNFRTDAGNNGRGFWVQYRGVYNIGIARWFKTEGTEYFNCTVFSHG